MEFPTSACLERLGRNPAWGSAILNHLKPRNPLHMELRTPVSSTCTQQGAIGLPGVLLWLFELTSLHIHNASTEKKGRALGPCPKINGYLAVHWRVNLHRMQTLGNWFAFGRPLQILQAGPRGGPGVAGVCLFLPLADSWHNSYTHTVRSQRTPSCENKIVPTISVPRAPRLRL